MKRKSIGYTFNHSEKLIIITKGFEKQSAIRNTTEHRELWKLRECFPDYDIQRRTARANPAKTSYKNLTLEKMVAIIQEEENNELKMNQFKEVLVKAKTEGGFGQVRAWFIKEYKEALKPKTPQAKKKLTIDVLLQELEMEKEGQERENNKRETTDISRAAIYGIVK